MSFVQDVLPCGCNHYFSGKIDSSNSIMGMIMKNKMNSIVLLALLFIGSPILFYTIGNQPRRTLLKEFFSILTILSFSLMLAQFFLARTNRKLVSEHSIRSIITTHKVIGYMFLPVLLIHPLLVIIPRFFESGVSGTDAFVQMITTLSSPGILLGICAWSLAFILGATCILRIKLSLTYKTWRLTHGILAILFIIFASWHAIDLGRHITSPFAYVIVFTALIGVLPLLTTYIFQSPMALSVKK